MMAQWVFDEDEPRGDCLVLIIAQPQRLVQCVKVLLCLHGVQFPAAGPQADFVHEDGPDGGAEAEAHGFALLGLGFEGCSGCETEDEEYGHPKERKGH